MGHARHGVSVIRQMRHQTFDVSSARFVRDAFLEVSRVNIEMVVGFGETAKSFRLPSCV